LEVNVGDTAQFTCGWNKISNELSPPSWVFNKKYYISKDTKKVKNSIMINDVEIKHSGTYHCIDYEINFYSLVKLKIQTFRVSTATLKVFGKWILKSFRH